MDPLSLTIDARWATGLVLSLARMTGFVIASPMLAAALPVPGRLLLVVALGLFFAAPVGATLGLGGLAAVLLVNVVVGVVLGYLTGMLFHLFATAGSLIDLTSGLSAATLVDPSQGTNAAVFSRLFNLTALTLFAAVGGLGLLVRGLALSLEAVPLDGRIAPHGDLAALTLSLLTKMLIAAAELALPVLAALFVAEVVLGLAARFAPQMNLFILGIPAKILVTMVVVGVCLVLYPEALDRLLSAVGDAFSDGLRGLTTG